MGQTRKIGALGAVVVGMAVLIGAVVVLATDEAGPTIGTNTLVNPPGQITANNSPTLVRHPDRPEHLVGAHRIDPTARSTSSTSSSGPGQNAGPAVVGTSPDGGETVGPPVQVAGELTFQPRLAVDPEGTVHAVWLQAADVALNRFVGQATIVASRSTDGGRSFSAPVPVSDPGRARVGAASPDISSDGDLVVLYEDFKEDRRDFEGLEGPPAEEPFALVVTRTSDGGQSFAPGVELESGIVPDQRFLVFLPEHPTLAAGPGDVLYATWHSAASGDEDVLLRRSDDGGATWGPAVRVNDNPEGDGTDQYLPRVSVAPGGRVDVLFYDRRLDPANVRTNSRVSSESFDSGVGPVFNVFDDNVDADFGTRVGLDSTDQGAAAAWTDTCLGSADDGPPRRLRRHHHRSGFRRLALVDPGLGPGTRPRRLGVVHSATIPPPSTRGDYVRSAL